VQRTLARLGARTSERLRNEALSPGGLRPRLNPAKVVAFILAGAVHVLTLAFAAGGIFLVTRGGILPIVAGIVLFGARLDLPPPPGARTG
jgi:hypothetical protein